MSIDELLARTDALGGLDTEMGSAEWQRLRKHQSFPIGKAVTELLTAGDAWATATLRKVRYHRLSESLKNARVSPLPSSATVRFESAFHSTVYSVTSVPYMEMYEPVDVSPLPRTQFHALVQHDWSAAFAQADEFSSGDVMLPGEVCAFEFQTGSRRVVYWMQSTSGSFEGREMSLLFIEGEGGGDPDWWIEGDVDTGHDDLFPHNLWDTAQALVRATCIALEADAAVATVITAPARLNRQRIASGKVPLHDYHIVELSARHRHRHEGPPTGRHGVRLHFRRGHWWPSDPQDPRRVWHRWALVGDPALGWVDKEYRA